MREIRFRAWIPDLELMEYAPQIREKDVGNMNDIFIDDDVVFMQYTGLKDKNGVEIYEGDIIKSYFLRKNGVIEYVNDKVCFMAKISMNEWHFISDLYDIEIIGNVYEN